MEDLICRAIAIALAASPSRAWLDCSVLFCAADNHAVYTSAERVLGMSGGWYDVGQDRWYLTVKDGRRGGADGGQRPAGSPGLAGRRATGPTE